MIQGNYCASGKDHLFFDIDFKPKKLQEELKKIFLNKVQHYIY